MGWFFTEFGGTEDTPKELMLTPEGL